MVPPKGQNVFVSILKLHSTLAVANLHDIITYGYVIMGK